MMMAAADAGQQQPPIFVIANVKFTLHGREYEFHNVEISVYGASGLRVSQFNPADTIGQEVMADIQVLTATPYEFRTRAFMTAERTPDNTFAGIKFSLTEADRERLTTLIKEGGFYPTSYTRKFPRIPARDTIPSMPLRAILTTESGHLFAMDIVNMSPGGILLHSENPTAAHLAPSTRIRGQIEPRGAMVKSLDFDGLICRALAEAHPTTRNVAYYLGIRFTRIPEEQRPVFLEILRIILQNIQETGLVK